MDLSSRPHMFWWPWPLRFRPHWDEPKPQGRWKQGGEGGHCPPSPFLALLEAKYSSSIDPLSAPLEGLKVSRGWIQLQPFFDPHFFTFRRPCTIDFYDDNNSSAAKDDSNTAGGAQSLQRMDSAPAFFFALQTLGQSLQDNDNNKRPLGQSYSDDGSKV